MIWYGDREVKDVSPAFYVSKVIRFIDKAKTSDWVEISVNDHNVRKFSFEISMEYTCDFHQSVRSEFCRNGLILGCILDENVISNHLIYGYTTCLNDNLVEYRNFGLGWLNYQGKDVFLLGNTLLPDGNLCVSARNTAFTCGDSNVYTDFLRNVVYKRAELSLAMAIGYSAVVNTRLKDQLDNDTIIVNLCRSVEYGQDYRRNAYG